MQIYQEVQVVRAQQAVIEPEVRALRAGQVVQVVPGVRAVPLVQARREERLGQVVRVGQGRRRRQEVRQDQADQEDPEGMACTGAEN